MLLFSSLFISFFFFQCSISCNLVRGRSLCRNATFLPKFYSTTQRSLIRFRVIQVLWTHVCIILRGSRSPKGEILAPYPNPSVTPPPKKKVSKGLKEAKTLKRYKVVEVLAPSASHLKVMGRGGMIGRCKEVVFFALLVFIPTFPNSFLKVQS